MQSNTLRAGLNMRIILNSLQLQFVPVLYNDGSLVHCIVLKKYNLLKCNVVYLI